MSIWKERGTLGVLVLILLLIVLVGSFLYQNRMALRYYHLNYKVNQETNNIVLNSGGSDVVLTLGDADTEDITVKGQLAKNTVKHVSNLNRANKSFVLDFSDDINYFFLAGRNGKVNQSLAISIPVNTIAGLQKIKIVTDGGDLIITNPAEQNFKNSQFDGGYVILPETQQQSVKTLPASCLLNISTNGGRLTVN